MASFFVFGSNFRFAEVVTGCLKELSGVDLAASA